MFEAAPHPASLRFLFAALACLAAALFLYLHWRARRREARAETWPTAAGIVERSRTARRWGFGTGTWAAGLWYVPDVSYRFEAGGRRYTASRVFLSDAGFTRLAQARRVIERYPRGAGVTVHYDPRNPKRTCLEPVYRERRALGTAVLLFALAAAALFIG